MSSRLPFDDHQLEIEETEGFLESPAKKPNDQTASSESRRAIGNRWAYAMLFCGFVLGIVMSSDDASLRFGEGKGVENVDDVSLKKMRPTFSPTGKPVPDLTPQSVVTQVPESNPSPNPTPNPTSQPEREGSTPIPLIESQTKNDQTQDGRTESLANDYDDYGASYYPKPSLVIKPDPPLSVQREAELIQKWGKWSFVDTKSDQRPKDDYCAAFSNRDIPREKFPANAWQTDVEYLKEWLDEGIKLTDRAMEAILSEYGHGKEDEAEKPFEERSKMFQMDIYDLKDANLEIEIGDNGGWTTEKSFQGLVRRVLHALMTNDSFNVILGGHSAAAGHGNHFKQSYVMQFHKIMEPVFALLGVSLLSRNLARGGLGTIQDSLGFRDSYGEDIDFMIWDSGMTERQDLKAIDMFFRMAVLSGNRVPFLIGGGEDKILPYMNVHTDADVASFGNGLMGLTECTDEIQCNKLPYATRYMKCSEEVLSWCKQNENQYKANCWVEREDVKPEKKQDEKPGSQVKWHPGFRIHQLTGRIISFTILRAMKYGLEKWQNADNYALPDEDWHVTNYYKNIRKKTIENTNDAHCKEYAGDLPVRICDIPMNCRTEYTPRANPEKTSITSIIKVNENGYKPHIIDPLFYTGPDVHNPFTELPEGEIDVLSIVSLGRKFEDARRMQEIGSTRMENRRSQMTNSDEKLRKLSSIIPGLGWEIKPQVAGYCDGTYNSECGRGRGSTCLLSGHSDSRNGLLFNSYSGWLVMTLPAIKEGLIIVKFESWHFYNENVLTAGWKSIDNKGQQRRRLKKAIPEYCAKFTFEFAIDGKVTVWNKDKFLKTESVIQRTVELATLLDNPDFTETPKDVELAIRITGCPGGRSFLFDHVYFA